MGSYDKQEQPLGYDGKYKMIDIELNIDKDALRKEAESLITKPRVAINKTH